MRERWRAVWPYLIGAVVGTIVGLAMSAVLDGAAVLVWHLAGRP